MKPSSLGQCSWEVIVSWLRTGRRCAGLSNGPGASRGGPNGWAAGLLARISSRYRPLLPFLAGLSAGERMPPFGERPGLKARACRRSALVQGRRHFGHFFARFNAATRLKASARFFSRSGACSLRST